MSLTIGRPGKGAIIAETAYAQGKMLDHSNWFGVLPRGITPSDIDMFFDNDGKIVYCEISRNSTRWEQIGLGQRLGYQSAIRNTTNVAVLWNHHVHPEKQIDTLGDCAHFQVMHYRHRHGFLYSDVFGGGRWRAFIEAWFKAPARVHEKLLKLSSVNENAFSK